MPPADFVSGVDPLINVCNVHNARAQIVDEVLFYSAKGDHSSCDLRNILSTLDLHDGKKLAHHPYSNPIHDRSNVNGTNSLPMDATTNHSRKRDPLKRQEQHKHLLHQAALP
ncbi:MAG TPA: hypothetical protein VEI46_09770 [Thermodesulfovibrionales bacterium]|nr:hypothetical protein [Thermodesulfovibrionales bacterium]